MKHFKYLLAGAFGLGVPVLLGFGIGALLKIAPVIGYSLFGLLILALMYVYGKRIINSSDGE